jgi:iron complex outermembrane receptor protein
MYGTTGTLWNVNQSAVDLNVISQSNLTFSDHFVKKANFLRLDHITLGYNFRDLIGHGIRVYTTVQNPFVVTKYDGLDPEIGNGIDNNIYPRPRTFVIGVNADFSVSKKEK